ncbi:MAG TPA: proline--tRNA ligase, partial [Planctomycetes bacterium]|nr:proline--tRNA ligase [Planctomycetota bacterium]
YEAYERIFTRSGLKFSPVEADSGAIGGSVSHEFMVPSPYGEDQMVKCGKCGYAANVERCEVMPPAAAAPGSGKLEEAATPGATTIDQVTAFLGLPPQKLVKTLLYRSGEKVVAALVRGDHELNEAKLARVLGAAVEMADAALVEKITGARVGFAGPLGLSGRGVRVIADNAVRGMADFVTGANKDDTHFVNVNLGRDFEVDDYADIRAAQEGDACPRCSSELTVIRSIEVGHVFKLGTKYSEAMNARFIDEAGTLRPLVMGCYGIGVSRIPAAAIESSHDEHGIIWPITIAPFEAMLIATNPSDAEVSRAADALYGELSGRGVETLLDDRDERAGVKFNDADLIGIPIRVTVGPRGIKEGCVEVKARDGSFEEKAPIARAAARIAELRGKMMESIAPKT